MDLLISAFSLIVELDAELAVIGADPLVYELRTMGEKLLGDRLQWIGLKRQDEIPGEMVAADCLALPSSIDGWGAVVPEALMAGAPVIASDRCGSAGVVKASQAAGIFPAAEKEHLVQLMKQVLATGRQSPRYRQQLTEWARCLAADAASIYLRAILDHRYSGSPRPLPPWRERSI